MIFFFKLFSSLKAHIFIPSASNEDTSSTTTATSSSDSLSIDEKVYMAMHGAFFDDVWIPGEYESVHNSPLLRDTLSAHFRQMYHSYSWPSYSVSDAELFFSTISP